MVHTIFCPKCLEVKPRSGHHIYPRVHYGRQTNGPLLYLCRECHDLADKLILHYPRLTKEEYEHLVREFLCVSTY